ncbi:unnamed protein product [Chrysodeixis includens]|uniref:Uncharacterized protein n=1 Tax=Chrysodeixis includens TaxID=689277 RepID=A0A9N8KY26_CHRIL|nr:unnamed protein product [Chrysodeixis includens]
MYLWVLSTKYYSLYFTSVMYILVVDIVTSKFRGSEYKGNSRKFNINQINISVTSKEIVVSISASLTSKTTVFSEDYFCIETRVTRLQLIR